VEIPDSILTLPTGYLQQGGAGRGATPPVRIMNPTSLKYMRMSTKPQIPEIYRYRNL
jgi:hypothetical protein